MAVFGTPTGKRSDQVRASSSEKRKNRSPASLSGTPWRLYQ